MGAFASDKFADKVVVITGAARGIGKAAAWRFAQKRATVILMDKDPEGVCQVDRDLSDCGYSSWRHIGDVTDNNFSREVAEKTREKFGTVDILVNCAGIEISDQGGLIGMPDRQFDDLLDVSLRGTRHVILNFLPDLAKKGVIVTVTPTNKHGRIAPSSRYPFFTSSILIFTEAIRSECTAQYPHKRIRVNSLVPGAILPPEVGTMYGEDKDPPEILGMRNAWAERAAEGILSLCSPDPEHKTGHVLTMPSYFSRK